MTDILTDMDFWRETGTTVTVVVAILTFKRPDELATGLAEVARQALELNLRTDGAVRASILVVDNDPEGSARTVVETRTEGLVRYVVEPQPGIAAARNRALDEAGHTSLLAFIDDDERPRENWLGALVATWTRYRAAAVAGRVISQFAIELDPWVAAGTFFARRSLKTGTALDAAATNNLLLDLTQVRAFGLHFDNSLGLSGGEDNLFTRQIVQRGGHMVWCEEAIVDDLVPAERTSRTWVLRRSWSHGNSASVVELHLASSAVGRTVARVKSIVKGLTRIVGGYLRYLWGLATHGLRHQARGLRAVYRGGGMIAGAFGVVYQEYARSEE